MLPHERSLVKKFEGRPFALVGVNSDESREELRDIEEKESITWRSFFDGPGTNGPIASTWNVRGWPTIYVIDHRGVIRHKNLRGKDLEMVLEELIEEAEKAGPAK